MVRVLVGLLGLPGAVDAHRSTGSRSAGTWLDQPRFIGDDDGLRAVAEVELVEDAGDVGLDGGVRDYERARDLAVGHSTSDQREYLEFPGREVDEVRVSSVIAGRAAAEFLYQAPGDGRCDERLSFNYAADRVGELAATNVLEPESSPPRRRGVRMTAAHSRSPPARALITLVSASWATR